MATINGNRASAGTQPKAIRVGVVTDVAVYSLAASISTGDVLQMLKVPAGARVHDVRVHHVGTGGLGSFVVGDGVDTDRYIDSGSPGSSTIHRMNRALDPYTYSVDDTLDIVYSLSSVQPSTGSVVLAAIIEYPGP